MAKVSKNVIKKIVIDIAGTTLELSLEQAKELRDILADTFPAEQKQSPLIIERIIQRTHDWPYRRWQPFYRDSSEMNAKVLRDFRNRMMQKEPSKGVVYLAST